jgi:hypothetical protein
MRIELLLFVMKILPIAIALRNELRPSGKSTSQWRRSPHAGEKQSKFAELQEFAVPTLHASG